MKRDIFVRVTVVINNMQLNRPSFIWVSLSLSLCLSLSPFVSPIYSSHVQACHIQKVTWQICLSASRWIDHELLYQNTYGWSSFPLKKCSNELTSFLFASLLPLLPFFIDKLVTWQGERPTIQWTVKRTHETHETQNNHQVNMRQQRDLPLRFQSFDSSFSFSSLSLSLYLSPLLGHHVCASNEMRWEMKKYLRWKRTCCTLPLPLSICVCLCLPLSASVFFVIATSMDALSPTIVGQRVTLDARSIRLETSSIERTKTKRNTSWPSARRIEFVLCISTDKSTPCNWVSVCTLFLFVDICLVSLRRGRKTRAQEERRGEERKEVNVCTRVQLQEREREKARDEKEARLQGTRHYTRALDCDRYTKKSREKQERRGKSRWMSSSRGCSQLRM